MEKVLLANLIKIAVIQMSVLLTPGQNFVLVVMHTINHSRKAGLYAALGATLGTAIYVLGSLFGLSAVMHEFPYLFAIVKYAGAAYIIYLGIKCGLSKTPIVNLSKDELKKGHTKDSITAIKDGLIANLLNPRAGIFFISLFTQVVPPTGSLVVPMIFGAESIILAYLWFCSVALFFSIEKLRNRFLQQHHIFKYAFAILLIFSGASMLLPKMN